MNVRRFDPDTVPSPWRAILIREVEKLKRRPDVIAVGIAGSLAQEDTWSHSDIDLEVVLSGDHTFTVLNTEQEISVDFGLFGESNLSIIPYETRPIYDPEGVLTRELSSRDLNEVLSSIIEVRFRACENYLKRAEEAYQIDSRSTLAFLHLFAWDLAELLTVASGDNRTVKLRCSRLERAMKAHNREDLLTACSTLYGLPETLQRSDKLLMHLQRGYREIWGFFKDKELGPRYMIAQSDSERWFSNRIQPVYEHDPRDLVWIVYIEFPFVTSFLFRNLTEHEKLPLDMFDESETFPEMPKQWATRHIECLDLLDSDSAPKVLEIARRLMREAKEFSDAGLYIREYE